MDTLLPKELLLLSQALVVHGAAQLELVSRALQVHPATAARSSLFTPQSCLLILQEMWAAEGIDPSRSPELRRPNARIHLKLTRKYYMARLAELRSKLSIEEEQMRKLLFEEKEINSGAWDARLTEGYDLVTASEEPAQAIYKHKYSATSLGSPEKQVAVTEAPLQPEPPTATTATQTHQEPPPPKEEAASPAKELHFADEVTTMPDSSSSGGERETSVNEREGTAGSALEDVPEEDEEADTSGQKQEPADQEMEEVDAEARNTKGPSVPPSTATKAGTSSSKGGSAPERRSSSRVSRNSIANLSEIIPSTSSDAADVTITSPLPDGAAVAEEAASPAREAVPPSSESMDLDMTSAAMEREDSKDSTAGPSSTNAGASAGAGNKRGRGARKSSAPPVTAKDANKRKRTTTPQAQGQNRASSPAPSERSRSKRIKTEEPESGLGTPVESDRTPGSSDASAIRRFRNSAPHLISQMVSSVNSTYFKEPVRQGEAVNYFEIIKRPMDLKTLSQNVRSGKVTTSAEFTRDLALIFANAIMYNGQEHHVGQDAVNMWREAQGLLRVLEAAEQRAM